MTMQNSNWGTIHASVYRNIGGLLRRAEATLRPHGAVRYCCPLTGAFVLITDEATLGELARPPARLRCADCGEVHLVSVEAAAAAA